MFKKIKRSLMVSSLSLPFLFGACDDSKSLNSDNTVVIMAQDMGNEISDSLILNSDDEFVVDQEVNLDFGLIVDSMVLDSDYAGVDFGTIEVESDIYVTPEVCSDFSLSFERLSNARYFYFKNEFTHVMNLFVSADCDQKFELNFSDFKRRFEQSVGFKYELEFRGSSFVGDGDRVSIYLKGRHLHDAIYLDTDENGIVDHVDLPNSIKILGPLDLNLAIDGTSNHFIYEPFEPKFSIYEIFLPDLRTVDVDRLIYSIILYTDIDFNLFANLFQFDETLDEFRALESSSLIINNGQFGSTSKYCAFNIVSVSAIAGYVNGQLEFSSPVQTDYSFSFGFIGGLDFQAERFLSEFVTVNNLNELAENSCAILPGYLNVIGANGQEIKLPNYQSNRPFVIGFNQ
ncbi:hypothetical protein CL656_02205 [bacterium]|nr:hypothetical protein [bacterium]